MQSTEQRKDPREVLDQQYNRRLDKLYTSAVRCPYCKKRIQKLQTVCSQCGLHKVQIAYASNKRARDIIKNREVGKVVKMRRRPTDVNMKHVAFLLFIGVFGAHNFYTGRRIRGWIMFGCITLFIVQALIFPFGRPIELEEGVISYVGMHPWREASIEWGAPFPLDFFGLVAMLLWFSDILGIIIGWYKYPVRLGEVNDAGKIWAK